MNQANANRFTAAGFGTAAAVVLVWCLDGFAGITPPAEVVAAFSVTIGSVVQAIYSLFRGWQTKPGGVVRTPWWVICLLLPLMFLGGCATMTYNDVVGAAYETRKALAETITAECGNTVPDGPCTAQSAISTDQKNKAKAALVLAGSYLADARAIEAGRAGMSCSDKWECLQAANSVLDVVEEMLEERQ